ncbi:hypothetical protein [Thalassovita sp.]|uniref:hypothetical protein n=1 Tax=Thalassovita sp. TaxID=1979401 RepID=UPI0029DE741D|nr:hypothetical protein [Thalassovita sp.]
MSSIDLSLENHLERDPRLDGWSVHGLGTISHTTEDWVTGFLSFEIGCELPAYLRDMFDRARACLVYGCYHYPLLTLGSEELFRFHESALREAVKEAGASKGVQNKPYTQLIEWAWQSGYLSDREQARWHASRSLRNSASHKVGACLVGPNDAAGTLHNTVELTETLFRRLRSTSRTL